MPRKVQTVKQIRTPFGVVDKKGTAIIADPPEPTQADLEKEAERQFAAAKITMEDMERRARREAAVTRGIHETADGKNADDRVAVARSGGFDPHTQAGNGNAEEEKKPAAKKKGRSKKAAV